MRWDASAARRPAGEDAEEDEIARYDQNASKFLDPASVAGSA